MAKEKVGSTNAEAVPKENAKCGDIMTAAKSTVDEGDYTHGWPANSGALKLNNSYPTKKKG